MKAFHVALAARRNWRIMRHWAIALVAGALAVGAAAQTDDHGDDRASATRVALPSETSGEIDPGGDEDWFRFEVAARGGVAVETTGGLDTIGALYDANGNVLAANDDRQDLNFRIRQALDAGTYYVQVLSFGSATGSYVLRLRRVAARQADRASATRVELPSETAAAIAAGGDADWFRFEVATRGEVTVETTGDLDTVGGLYDANGIAVAFDDDSGAVTNFRIRRALDAGTYFVQVEPFDNDDIGNYALRLQSAAGGGSSPAAAGAGHLRNLGDFNGDGRDDVLLRHADGRWRYYPMDGATVLAGGGAANLTRDLAWRIAGIGDFDGDGRDDVLLRKTDGRWYFYPMDGRSVLAGRGTARMTRDLAWRVAGIGDLDGDGRDDVLLRHEDGRWHYYRMNGRRPLAGSGSGRLTRNLDWRMAGVGDFDGDGRDDVLLRRRDDGRWYFYPMNGRASIAGRGTVPLTRDLAWAVAGVGDFDADGRHDVLLRHADGRWRYYPLQGRRVLDGAGLVNLTDDTTTTVAGIGDLNYDGCADVLARLAGGGWRYYALDGRRVLPASGEAALSGDLAWGALSTGGVATTGGAPTPGTTLTDRSGLTPGRNVTIDLADAFEDDQPLAYEARSSDAGVVRASVDGDALTLTPVAAGAATVTVTARDPDGNSTTQTFAVTVAGSDGTDTGGGSGGDTFRDCAACPLMARIPAGTFTMGAPESEPRSSDIERPQRTVSIPAFAAGVHEVTFVQWDACVADGGGCGSRPRDRGWGREERPVVNVSWDDAQSYVDWLSRTTGQRYRLLTESEWEFAARAGTATPFHTGETITPEQANYDGRYGYPSGFDASRLNRRQTVPVGSFAPNGFGLHDMHGNVWEWVQDCRGTYENAPSDGSAAEREGCSDRTLRGGSWSDRPRSLRSAYRFRVVSGFGSYSIGFRVARTL